MLQVLRRGCTSLHSGGMAAARSSSPGGLAHSDDTTASRHRAIYVITEAGLMVTCVPDYQLGQRDLHSISVTTDES